jgi:RHH-type transcriptional regulator, proline utilization regulon repressor / proline dehydrogenase / delta 1-pyrroline-5-carboxylate dehydrogenase
MKDDSFKVQLFRFVDVLPSLKTDELVVRMLNEYFSDLEDAPALITRGLELIPSQGIRVRIAAAAIRTAVESLAGQFIAARNVDEAVPAIKKLRQQGLGCSLALLGEEVLSEHEARQYVKKYLALLTHLGPQVKEWPSLPQLESDHRGRIPELNVSVKVSSLYSQLDPLDWEGSIENAKASLAPIWETAAEVGASITLDMEQYHLKDLTLAFFMAALEAYPEFHFGGIVVQAYLEDSREDLLRLIDWAKSRSRRITVRLVKGAYWDYETIVNRRNGWPVPVFLNKQMTDLNYEELTRILLENIEWVRPAIATHSMRSISHALAAADCLGLPQNALEFQNIYGMAEPIRTALVRLGCRVRVYTGIGELIPGMGYLIRRLLENTSNESFLRRSFVDEIPIEELLKRPEPESNFTGREEIGDAFRNEPPTDFSRGKNRQSMKTALTRIKQDFGRKYPLLIGTEDVLTEEEGLSLNPARPSEVIGRVSLAGKEEAELAVREARKAWVSWKKTPPQDRAGVLFAAAKEMRKQRFDLAAIEVYEVGKTWTEADGDVAEAIDYLEYYGREMQRLGPPRFLGDYPGESNEYVYEPRGAGVVISPWNFPLAIPTGMVSAALVSGNCVLFKPSGLSPVIGRHLVDILVQAGIPPGVLQFIPGPGSEVGEYLVSHPDIDFIAFTGSKDVGLRIVELAGKIRADQRNVKKVIAEMGGKNAVIVDETADMDEAVRGVLESALGYQGQKCSACSRVIVVGEIFDEFCGRLTGAMESIRIGPPDQPGVFMGPVIDHAALQKIRAYIDIGRREGQPLLIRTVDGEGYFVGPVVISNVEPDSAIAQEEVFGPVVTVFKAGHIDEAVAIANRTRYALTGGVYSRSPANVKKVKSEFNVGNLYINRKITGALVGRQPFGGFGMSGVGSKAGGPDYLVQFMLTKSISENTMRRGFAPKTAKTM